MDLVDLVDLVHLVHLVDPVDLVKLLPTLVLCINASYQRRKTKDDSRYIFAFQAARLFSTSSLLLA